MTRTRTVMSCRECRQQVSRWAGRCPGCGAWGTIVESPGVATAASSSRPLGSTQVSDERVRTGIDGVDRVLGGGLVPGSVALLAGDPGIGKSTLLLHLIAGLTRAGRRCLLVSGEESQAQVAARAARLGIEGGTVSFAPGRDLESVMAVARADEPYLLAVDSIQALRDTFGSQMPGGVSQVRLCTDALVGLAKSEGIAVLMTGHVTKDGDLAGPRALEHAVDVVLSFEGDARSGLRVLAGGKNRFGSEGESAWFEMAPTGLSEIDPTSLLVSGDGAPGAATSLPLAGRRALAVEVQALVGGGEGSARRHATGIDGRRFRLVAAVLDRAVGVPLSRAELHGASSGGVRIDDPACDLAIAASLVSAATQTPAPAGSAFVGEISLTGIVRSVPGMEQRLAAARAAGCSTVFAPTEESPAPPGLRVVPIRHVSDALGWATVAEASMGR